VIGALLAASVSALATDWFAVASPGEPALGATARRSQPVAPDVLLNAVTADVIAVLKQEKDAQAGNSVKVAALVEPRVLPLFDFTRMTKIAMARNWRLASPEQQTALTREFGTLLVRIYSTALSNYRDQVIEFKRLRLAPGDSAVTVRSELKHSGREQTTIDYDMEKTPAGWKVYDIKVGGVSMVTTFRETFADRVRDGGVEGLLKSLADQNRHDDSRFKSYQAAVLERSRHFFALLHSALTSGQ